VFTLNGSQRPDEGIVLRMADKLEAAVNQFVNNLYRTPERRERVSTRLNIRRLFRDRVQRTPE